MGCSNENGKKEQTCDILGKELWNLMKDGLGEERVGKILNVLKLLI